MFEITKPMQRHEMKQAIQFNYIIIYNMPFSQIQVDNKLNKGWKNLRWIIKSFILFSATYSQSKIDFYIRKAT